MSMNLVGAIGHKPSVMVGEATPDPEVVKYQKVWSDPRYREFSPGE